MPPVYRIEGGGWHLVRRVPTSFIEVCVVSHCRWCTVTHCWYVSLSLVCCHCVLLCVCVYCLSTVSHCVLLWLTVSHCV